MGCIQLSVHSLHWFTPGSLGGGRRARRIAGKGGTACGAQDDNGGPQSDLSPEVSLPPFCRELTLSEGGVN
eukprot:2622363-Prymnesium_polylepis.1